MILPAIAGLIVVVIILLEVFETIVLPRRVTRRFRVTVLFYRGTWIPWRGIARHFFSARRRETFLSFYGPLSLLFLFDFWAIALVFGFGLLYYSTSRTDAALHSFATCLYLSGTTLFTLGIGDVTPHNWFERGLVVSESGLGLGFLALVLSYLPVIYQAFSRREVNIVLLDARAGSPPTAAELLRRHSGPHGLDALQQLLRDWERWSAQLLESHISYPVVSYFRSQHSNESWLAALTAILDVSALMISNFADDACTRQARLTFAMCRHTVADLAQVFYAKPRPATHDRLPPAELKRLRAAIAQVGLELKDTPASNEKLSKVREMYEPYVQALARHLYLDLPPWILSKEITDNWRTSAWGRISGFSGAPEEGLPVDAHSD